MSLDLVEPPTRFDGTRLRHVFPASALQSILVEGVRPRSYWAIESVSDYYAETFDDEGVESLCLEVPIERLAGRTPDMPGIEEPVVFGAMGKREAQVQQEWSACSGTWMDSLEIIGSIACDETVPVTMTDLVPGD
jgi:hypothetical protein